MSRSKLHPNGMRAAVLIGCGRLPKVVCSILTHATFLIKFA